MTDGTRVELDLADTTQALAYLTRRYAPEITDWIVNRLPQSGTFVDVGANVGLITFSVHRRVPEARVIAFEPVPGNEVRWHRNRNLNGSRACLEPVALADKPGVARFLADCDSGWGRLSADGDIRVQVRTLDSYCAEHGIDRIDVLKLDTEGAEPRILDGAQTLLERGAIRALVAEMHESNADAILRRLMRYGFRRVPMPKPGIYGLRRHNGLDAAFVL